MAFDAGMLSFVVREINDKLAGAKIEKIYQPQKDEVVFVMKQGGDTLRLLINGGSSSPRINITSAKAENPATPPMFCMVLRKHLGGAKLDSAEQLGFERAVRLTFSTYDELGFSTKKHIIAEIMGKYSDIILTDINDRIIGVLKPVDFSTSKIRQLLPGMKYELPPRQDKDDPLTADLSLFDEYLSGSAPDRRADKFITDHYAGISAAIAREIAFRCGGTVNATLSECGNWLKSEFSSLVENIRESIGEPVIVYDENDSPVEYSFVDMTQYGAGFRRDVCSSFGEMIDIFFEKRSNNDRLKQRAADIFRIISGAEGRILRKIDKQKSELVECNEDEKYKLWGDLITANIWRISRGADSACVENYYGNGEEVVIPLEKRLSPAQNAQKYYKKYTKLKNARAHLTEQIAIAENELEYIYTVLDSLVRADTEKELAEIRGELYHSGYASKIKNYTAKKQTSFAILKYITSGGYTVYCGKNNIANDHLTTKIAAKNDWWFHVKDRPGSHVVMVVGDRQEPSSEDFTEAAMIAAYHSKAQGAPNVDVDYTLVRNVKKPAGSKPGFVVYQTNWSATVTPDEKKIKAMLQK